jgi:hypothetical protein
MEDRDELINLDWLIMITRKPVRIPRGARGTLNRRQSSALKTPRRHRE